MVQIRVSQNPAAPATIPAAADLLSHSQELSTETASESPQLTDTSGCLTWEVSLYQRGYWWPPIPPQPPAWESGSLAAGLETSSSSERWKKTLLLPVPLILLLRVPAILSVPSAGA